MGTERERFADPKVADEEEEKVGEAGEEDEEEEDAKNELDDAALAC